MLPVRPLRPWETLEDNPAILSTGYIPDCVEARALRSRVAERLDELSSYSRFGPEGSQRTLARRQALEQANIVAETLLCPVRKLPAEILGEIFVHAIPNLDFEGALDPIPAPYDNDWYPHNVRRVICQVCRFWNSVALNTPLFWSSLTIYDKTDFFDLKRGVKHSRNRPLDIYIEGAGFEERATEILSLICPELYRIRQIIYAVPWHDEVCWLFPRGSKATDAPNLEVFAWTAKPLDDGDPVIYSLGHIHCPNLQVLALEDDPAMLIRFSADSLRNVRRLFMRTLEVHAQYAKFYLDFLVNCPSVVELEISWISTVWEWEQYIGPKVPLLSLKSLVITESDDQETGDFLAFICVPHLETLRISENNLSAGRPSHVERGLRALQAEASQTLQTLALESVDIIGEFTTPIFPPFAKLVTLHFSNCFIGDAVLASLTPTNYSEPWPCPLLSQLTFTKVNFTLPGDALLALVRSRTGPSHARIKRPNDNFTFVTLDRCPVAYFGGLNAVELRMIAQDLRSSLRILV